jgi:hypothetical protein
VAKPRRGRLRSDATGVRGPAADDQGATNREIATTIFLSEETVKSHVKRILQKFGVANRGQAVATYLKVWTAVLRRLAAIAGGVGTAASGLTADLARRQLERS